MRYLLLVSLALIPVCTPFANETNLYGGVLIAHHPPEELIFSDLGIPWCDIYEDYCPISDASEQVNRTDIAPGTWSDIWYVIAAFNEDKIWCGAQFGLGEYDTNAFYFTGFNVCLENAFNIPTSGWPAPNTGIAIAAGGISWTGNYKAICAFYGYAYSGDPTVIPIIGHPDGDFIGFGNCESPALLWTAQGGAFGVLSDGIAVYPQDPPPDSPCCLYDGGCIMVMLEEDCYAAGGCLFDDGAPYGCDPNPCPISIPPICCLPDGSCLGICEWQCDELGGEVMYDVSGGCKVSPCPLPSFPCCLYDGDCILTTSLAICHNAGGCFWFEGDYGGCDINPCPQSIPPICCFPDGSCMEICEWQCDNLGGQVYSDIAGGCDGDPCPSIDYACCLYNGDCIITDTVSECYAADGCSWIQGIDQSCDPNPCPQSIPPVCCFTDGSCLEICVWQCENLSGDVFYDVAGGCAGDPCPVINFACCLYNGDCIITSTSADCDAAGGCSWIEGTDQTCDPNPCPQGIPPICCFTDGTCLEICDWQCVDLSGEIYLDVAGGCDGDPCPIINYACCFADGSCLELNTEQECYDLQGCFWYPDSETCDPNPCPNSYIPICCLEDDSCVQICAWECLTMGGAIRYDLEGCVPNPCVPVPADAMSWGRIKTIFK